MPGPQISFLPDGRRLHLHHGPIDLIIAADGPGRAAGLARAARRFDTLLAELAAELPQLRRPVTDRCILQGRVARAMQRAALAHAHVFVTPMAAVAGAVADEILAAICADDGLRRVHVNNGGDVAFHLVPGAELTAAIAAPNLPRITLHAAGCTRGMATSGWRGRSLSLGIADSVTVLARTAARADVAATLIANAVDLPGHAAVRRAPANQLFADSDLGDRPVTVDVAALGPDEVARALGRGQRLAESCLARDLITGAVLTLGPACRVVAAPDLLTAFEKDRIHA
ncbi:UPF0280 family protein [Sedimentitalea sp. HM32M-2]|uniref:UPF0280 family protein n=1 Tax=Sedimentitalea sp. HM32M-2 TaxID=3351566 RepID=UPI00363EEB35